MKIDYLVIGMILGGILYIIICFLGLFIISFKDWLWVLKYRRSLKNPQKIKVDIDKDITDYGFFIFEEIENKGVNNV
jgi:hypoxanthine-guanine phosphoribosyltransferase